MKIAPSILSANFARLVDAVRLAEQADADYLHLDVMDGHFVPAITFGPKMVCDLKKITSLPLDVHLMISNPDAYIKSFIDAGADILTIHAEASIHLHRSVQLIKQTGIKCGVAINPATPLCSVDYILHDIDLLLIMTVNPGFGGQSFITHMLDKIRQSRVLLNKSYPKIKIEVDGGVKRDNISIIAQAGMDIAVAGSAVFGDDDPVQAIHDLRDSAIKR